MPQARDGVRIGARPRGTFELLDEIATILGTTKDSFWPFLESVGSQIVAYKDTDKDLTSKDATAARALESEFAPFRHPGGVYSYYLDKAGDQHLAGPVSNPTHADFSFGDGSVDSVFSVGLWVRPLDVSSLHYIAKYDLANNLREWVFFLDGSSKPALLLEDESVVGGATEVGTADTALVKGVWAFICATYDGEETAPKILHYQNGAVDGNGATTESGLYVSMEKLTAELMIGASGDTGLPVSEFNGRIALPFVTGKELSATEILQLYQIGRELLGV